MASYYRNFELIDLPSHIAEAGTLSLKNLREITIFLGKNGCGKSTILRAISKKLHGRSFHYVNPERGGGLEYSLKTVHQEGTQGVPAFTDRDREENYRERVIGRINRLLLKLGVNEDRIRESKAVRPVLKQIKSTISDLFSDIQVDFLSSPPIVKVLREGREIKDRELSSGEGSLLTLVLDILAMCGSWEFEARAERTLLIDEPDLHLHPDLQASFARALLDICSRYEVQAFVATHSVPLVTQLAQIGPDRCGVFFLNSRPLPSNIVASKVDSSLIDIAALLGGNALLGPLLGYLIMLVEGDDDQLVWNIASRNGTFSRKVVQFSCGGTRILQYRRVLSSLLDSLAEVGPRVRALVLLDNDKKTEEVTVGHVWTLRLRCNELENLALSTQCLKFLGFTWDDACNKLLHGSSGHSCDLSSCKQWNRKDNDLKDVVPTVISLLSDNKITWQQLIGRTLALGRPEGELADWLGNNLIKILWDQNNN